MPSSTRTIELTGIFASGVLGTFRIIRGFAPLQDLAAVSAPFEMGTVETPEGVVTGYQRSINDQHAEEIKRYLEQGSLRFIPEVILSARVPVEDVTGDAGAIEGVQTQDEAALAIKPRRKGQAEHTIRVPRQRDPHEDRLIRRLDGNHRLHFADQLQPDERNATKYLAPYCLILLGPPDDPRDDYNEAMLFHTMNSTAYPVDSEHALRLLLGQPESLLDPAEQELATNPSLHLTRQLRARLRTLPQPQQERLGDTPMSELNASAEAMIAQDRGIVSTVEGASAFAEEFHGAMLDILPRLQAEAANLVKAKFFFQLVSLVWRATPGGEHAERVAAAANKLTRLAKWLGDGGLDALNDGGSIAQQVLEIYESIERRIPKRVFLARWYPTEADGDEFRKGNLRKDQIDRALTDLAVEGIELALDDPGTREGGTFPIHEDMYRAIERNDIVLIDLSGVRPNVCIEAGFALQHGRERLIFLFQPTAETDNNPAHTRPPFDLLTFQHQLIDDAAEIPAKLTPHLRAIVENARQGL